MKIVEKLKKVFNAFVDTKEKIDARNEAVKRELDKFVFKTNRRSELMQAADRILTTKQGDLYCFDDETGEIFLDSEINKKGENAKPIVIINTADEKKLFDYYAKLAMMEKWFDGCGPNNPMVVAESGRGNTHIVYAKNKPSEIRGTVTIGGAVYPSSSRKKNFKY